jgi:putative selenate reductase FAD-binding subunit
VVSEIFRPKTLGEAVRLASMPDTAVLGGGTWLNAAVTGTAPGSTPATVTGRPRGPLALVSLEKLGLDFVEWRNAALRLGAAATFQQVLDAPGVPEAVRVAVGATASRTLRNMITLGGELGLCSPDSVLIPVLAALDARVQVAGRRPLGIEEYRSARATGPVGLVVEVSAADADRPCAVASLARTSHGRRSLVIAVSATRLFPKLSRVRIVASDCRGQVLRLADAENALEGSPLPREEQVESIVRAAFWPTSDMHASTEYKRYLAGVYAADLLRGLAARESER